MACHTDNGLAIT